jgi:hypothetical protein
MVIHKAERGSLNSEGGNILQSSNGHPDRPEVLISNGGIFMETISIICAGYFLRRSLQVQG